MTPTSAPDELERLRAADPLPVRAAQGASPELLLARIEEQVSRVPADHATSTTRVVVRRRVVSVVSVTVALLATAAVGSAVLRGGQSPSISCVTGDALVVINAVSPDPIADCVARLATEGETLDADTLTTFVTDDGAVVVAPDQAAAGEAVIGDPSPAPDLRSETDLVELRLAIDDVVTGVGDCADAAAVSERARMIADRVGFGHWEIVERERPGGSHCGWAFVDLEEQRIVVSFEPVDTSETVSGAIVRDPDGQPIPVPDGLLDIAPDADGALDPYAEIIEVSREIHETIERGCLSSAEAEDAVRSVVARTSQAATAQITVNEDPDAACARVYTNAYGGFEITIFGR